MTIKLLAFYGPTPPGSLLTLDATTEAALVAASQATTNLTGGVVWTPPGNSPASSLPVLASASTPGGPLDTLTAGGQSLGSVSGGSISVAGNLTINAANAATYNGKTLIWSAAYTVTLAADLPTDFGFSGRPPASGNASIASANTGGLPTLDGATTTVTRALAGNKLFAVVWVASNAYTVTGS